MRSSDGEVELAAKRKTVAAWIERLVGVPVSVSSDYSFRTCLKDGVVEVANQGISEEYQSTTNVSHFLHAAVDIGLPGESLFTLEDLHGSAWEQYPEVVKTLYRLQRHADRLGLPVPQEHDRAMPGHGQLPYSHNVQTMGGYGSNPPSVGSNPTGISRLLSEATQMLKDKGLQNQMGQPMVPPSPGMTAASAFNPGVPGLDYGMQNLGGMLRQMLSELTSQQEKISRFALVEREDYVKSLEVQVQRFSDQTHEAQMRMEQNKGVMSPSDMDDLQCSAEKLAIQLEDYRKANRELQDNLQEERSIKAEMEQKYVQMKTKVESLDGVHTKYKAIQSENRELYNMVQDLRGNIRVFCRVRPLGATGDASENCIDVGADGEVAVMGTGNRSDKKKVFNFDKVFAMASTQEEVYSETQPLIRSVLDGYNVCIFAYGQTGSGKTHTMSGTDVENYSGRGINYRALDDLFEIQAKRSEEVDFNINVQMLEIYNETLRDLLNRDPNKVNKLDIRSTEKSGLNVPDALQVAVTGTEDVLEVMETGSKNRAVSGTKMNDRSSRSHSVLTVVVEGCNRLTGVRTHGCLHLVDLAGSERIARSEATGDRLEEAKHINKSLSALGDVMAALAAKSNHVPFRNSKLTQLLQDSLSGQAKAMMFVHVAPESSSRGETLSTAMFGNRVSQITLGQAHKNTESGKIFEAREAISKLRTSAQTKDERIKELAKVVETERAAAKSAMSEKQRMEEELKTLRDELNLTRRAVCSSDDPPPQARTMSATVEKRSRVLSGKDPIDQQTRTSRRSTSMSGHPRPDMSARSTISRSSTASKATTARSSRLSTVRSSVLRTPLKDGTGSNSNRPSTGLQRTTSTLERSTVGSKSSARRPATAGPQNPRRIALARTSANGGWR